MGKLLSQVVPSLNDRPFIGVAVEAEAGLVIRFGHEQVLFDFVLVDLVTGEAGYSAIFSQASPVGNERSGKDGAGGRNVDHMEEIPGAVRVEGTLIRMARQTESRIADRLFEEVFLLVRMSGMAGFTGDEVSRRFPCCVLAPQLLGNAVGD